MSTKIITAILGCTMLQYVKVFDLSKALLAGLYFYTALYPNPKYAKDEFELQYQTTSDLYDQVQGGREDLRSDFDTNLKTLWSMIGDLLYYVNGLYRGQPEKLSKSGFPLSAEPTPHGLPGQMVINKIVNGPVDHSAKIKPVKGSGFTDTVKGGLTYLVQKSEDGIAEENFKDFFQVTDRRKIIGTGLTRGKEYYFRIAAFNSKGQGLWSDPASFVAQ